MQTEPDPSTPEGLDREGERLEGERDWLQPVGAKPGPGHSDRGDTD